jgi:hypothetical protein
MLRWSNKCFNSFWCFCCFNYRQRFVIVACYSNIWKSSPQVPWKIVPSFIVQTTFINSVLKEWKKNDPLDNRQHSHRRQLKNVPYSFRQRFSLFWQQFSMVAKKDKWCSGLSNLFKTNTLNYLRYKDHFYSLHQKNKYKQ